MEKIFVLDTNVILPGKYLRQDGHRENAPGAGGRAGNTQSLPADLPGPADYPAEQQGYRLPSR